MNVSVPEMVRGHSRIYSSFVGTAISDAEQPEPLRIDR